MAPVVTAVQEDKDKDTDNQILVELADLAVLLAVAVQVAEQTPVQEALVDTVVRVAQVVLVVLGVMQDPQVQQVILELQEIQEHQEIMEVVQEVLLVLEVVQELQVVPQEDIW